MEFFIAFGCACSIFALFLGINCCLRINKIEEKIYKKEHDN